MQKRSTFQHSFDIIGDAYGQRQLRQPMVTEFLRSTFRK
jgi:hypothetical protein